MRLVIIAIVALIVIAVAYYFLTQQETSDLAQQAGQAVEQAVEEASDAAQEGADKVSSLVVDGVDLGKEIGTELDNLKTSLEGITDKASAEAALPKLEELKSQMEGWGKAVEQLPADGKTALAGTISASLPTLESLAAKLDSIEGVGPVIKPTLDDILASLKQWSEASG
jgi:type II secretory pathway pseudopilin PulG